MGPTSWWSILFLEDRISRLSTPNLSLTFGEDDKKHDRGKARNINKRYSARQWSQAVKRSKKGKVIVPHVIFSSFPAVSGDRTYERRKFYWRITSFISRCSSGCFELPDMRNMNGCICLISSCISGCFSLTYLRNLKIYSEWMTTGSHQDALPVVLKVWYHTKQENYTCFVTKPTFIF